MHDLRRRFACSSGRGNKTTARAICLTKRGRRPKKFGKGIAQLRDADPGAFINTAIEVGSRDGIGALDADQRLVYLISEAEVSAIWRGSTLSWIGIFGNGWKRL